tara:strand:+ start:6575 stop:7057 length:483 start_codon:yes stop_codon:yes gene_type:complete
MTDPIEEIEPVVEKPSKVKKTRSPEQLEVLAKARAKAMEVRKANAELRKQEKDIEKAEKEQKLKERKAKVDKYNKPVVEQEDYVEPIVIKKKAPKKKKIIVVEESDSESSDEEEVVIVKKKKKPIVRTETIRQPVPQIDQRKLKAQKNYNTLYKQMFSLS